MANIAYLEKPSTTFFRLCCLKTLFLLSKLDKSISEVSPATEQFKGFVAICGKQASDDYKGKGSIGYSGTKHPHFSSKSSGFV